MSVCVTAALNCDTACKILFFNPTQDQIRNTQHNFEQSRDVLVALCEAVLVLLAKR